MRVLIALTAVLVVAGCTLPATPGRAQPEVTVEAPRSPESGEPTSSSAPEPEVDPVVVRAQLQALTVAPRVHRDDYDRDAFGSSWSDIDGNGCNQRDDVLQRDAVPGSLTVGEQGRCDHDVLAGTWVDPYTGTEIVLTDAKEPRQAQAVQIDHIVPLSEAWSSGAFAWSEVRRLRFANHLAGLLASDGPTNASKGDDDPAAWRPRKGFQCEYAARWIGVKARWGLDVDPSEVRALEEMLGYCPQPG